MARSRVCTAPAYREGPRLRACAGARRSAWLYGSHRAGCGAQCCRELAPEWEESMRTGSTATGRRLPQEQLPSDRSCARRHEGPLEWLAERRWLMEGATAAPLAPFSSFRLFFCSVATSPCQQAAAARRSQGSRAARAPRTCQGAPASKAPPRGRRRSSGHVQSLLLFYVTMLCPVICDATAPQQRARARLRRCRRGSSCHRRSTRGKTACART